MKKLTVAIPTYNRAKELRQTLESLYKEKSSSEINIFISDNASQDNTQEIVSDFIRKNNASNIEYSLNKENIGFDGNVLKCYSECQTDYIWILADDDELIQGGLDKLIEDIDKYTIICLNNTEVDEKLGMIPVSKKINSDDEYERWDTISKFVWLSRLVVKKTNRDLLLLDDYKGTGLIHLAILNNVLLNNKDSYFCITNYSALKNQPHYVFSNNFTDVFVNQFYKFCCLPQSHFSRILARNVAKANIPFVINGLLSHKTGSKIFKYNFKLWYLIRKMIFYKVEIKWIVKFILIYFIPKFIFRINSRKKTIKLEEIEKETHI